MGLQRSLCVKMWRRFAHFAGDRTPSCPLDGWVFKSGFICYRTAAVWGRMCVSCGRRMSWNIMWGQIKKKLSRQIYVIYLCTCRYKYKKKGDRWSPMMIRGCLFPYIFCNSESLSLIFLHFTPQHVILISCLMEHTSKPNRSSLCYFLLVGDQNDIVRFLGLCCVTSEEFGRKSQTFAALYTGKVR